MEVRSTINTCNYNNICIRTAFMYVKVCTAHTFNMKTKSESLFRLVCCLAFMYRGTNPNKKKNFFFRNKISSATRASLTVTNC